MQKHIVIDIPGLDNDQKTPISKLMFWWKYIGFEVIHFPTNWNGNESFENKLERLSDIILHIQSSSTVSLLGRSAGGSLAFNAFIRHKNRVKKAVNVLGALRFGTYKSFPSLKRGCKRSPSWEKSVESFSSQSHILKSEDRKRLMTVRPRFGDEVVPVQIMSLNGAYNIVIPSGEHVISGAFAVALPFPQFALTITDFLKC
jgi:pimeloyl-ACP methyl ester carboxylesterase